MKKIFGIIFICIMLLSLVGCSKDIPTDGMYHPEDGITVRLGMTKEEVEENLKEFKEEKKSSGDVYSHYTDRLEIHYEDGRATSIMCFSDKWMMPGNINLNNTPEELKKTYGEPTGEYENTNKEVTFANEMLVFAREGNMEYIFTYPGTNYSLWYMSIRDTSMDEQAE